MGESRQARIDRHPNAFARIYRHVLYSESVPSVKLVAAVIADHQGKTKHGVERAAFPSYAHIGKLLGYSDKTVARAVRKLVEIGAIRIERRPGTTNLMTMLPTPDTGVRGGEENKPGLDSHTEIVESPVSGGSDTDVPQRRTKKKNQEEDHAGREAGGGSQRPTPGVAGTPDSGDEPAGATLDELKTHPNETIRQIVERLSRGFGDMDSGEDE